MFGNSAKTTDSSSVSSSSALSQIRAALSSSKNAAKPAMIEAEKPKDNSTSISSLLSRKIGNLSQATNSEDSKQAKPETSIVASAYSIIPTWLFSWKTMLVFIIIFAIVWIVRPYISLFSDIANTFKSIMGDSNETEKETETKDESIAEPTVTTKGEKKVKDMIEGTMAPTIPEEITEPAITEGPIPDDAASSTQGGSQGGFCLAGEWKGKRTCVKVEKSSDCQSGQLFGTEAICQNPSLRM